MSWRRSRPEPRQRAQQLLFEEDFVLSGKADPSVQVRLILLRHGHVASHRGDVPITDRGLEQAAAAGRWFAGEGQAFAGLLASPTRRTRETAVQFAAGYGELRPTEPGMQPRDSAALRNPDLYLGGHLVNMVSSPAAFVEQVPTIAESDVVAVPFFRSFLTEPDRVGYWVAHSHPPGDTVLAVGRRIVAVVRSLADVRAWSGQTILGITHSPVLRAIAVSFLGADPGEPTHLHGYSLSLGLDGALTVEAVGPERPAA
ncbi:MAG TPA: histidine phosphatase family protein [Microbacterium sp.]|uniref:histidine phosphatase family protein n=1 Tax=Microbacterium sp. TaxID=51671 RepID=UPI002C6C15A2|nr:histidine phosphatase family protein [Microbacterium sp.]HWI32169.1 histidine phosphatase family protein [Microbacterium sp.]